MSEIGGSGSEVGGGSEVSSSEVSEAPAAETGGKLAFPLIMLFQCFFLDIHRKILSGNV